MKRLIVLVFFGFWVLGIFFLIRFFTTLRSTYRSKASLAQNTVLKIVPIVNYDPNSWSEQQTEQVVSRYHGLIVKTTDLSSLKTLKRQIQQKNPQFPIYLQLSPTQKTVTQWLFPTPMATNQWYLNNENVDIRDPLYRQAFFSFYQRELNDLGVNGVYLTGIGACPTGVTDLECQSQYSWWKMATLDFMSQIRQYFTQQTILFEATPLVNNQEDFTQQLLQQTDGMVLTDFASIYNDESSFYRYYQFLSGILQNPQYQQKQLIFHVTADDSLQPFFQASYLLFANEFSGYYFASTQAGLPQYQLKWQQEYQPSLNFAMRSETGLYERQLSNALVLVNPSLVTQETVLNQTALEGQTLRLWNDQPYKYGDSVTVPSKSGQILNQLSSVSVAPTEELKRLADWSDLNTSRYSDFEDLFVLHNSSALSLGNSISLEEQPKNYDDFDDGLFINGLEAGIFNLEKLTSYQLQLKLNNKNSNAVEVWVWVDWDGKGNLPPTLIFNQANFASTKLDFELTVPDYAHDYVFLRVVAKDQDQGEVEDYLLKVQ